MAQDEQSRFPAAHDIIKSKMYVDDILTGSDIIAEARDKAGQLDQLLMAGGFTLHKWTCNDPNILITIETSRLDTESARIIRSDTLCASTRNRVAAVFRYVSYYASPLFRHSSQDHKMNCSISSRINLLRWITPVTIVAKILRRTYRSSNSLGTSHCQLPTNNDGKLTSMRSALVASPYLAGHSSPLHLSISNSTGSQTRHDKLSVRLSSSHRNPKNCDNQTYRG